VGSGSDEDGGVDQWRDCLLPTLPAARYIPDYRSYEGSFGGIFTGHARDVGAAGFSAEIKEDLSIMKSRRKIQGKHLTKRVGCVYNPVFDTCEKIKRRNQV